MLSEKVVLLGRDLYNTVPNEIMINAVPTASELEYVGAEDFDSTMLNSIFPKVIESGESMDFSELLDIDFDWICRCLRMKSYGPYFTTNRIYCGDCGEASRGDYQVDLRSVPITPLPENFENRIVIDSDEFIDCKDRFVLKLPTVKDRIQLQQDSLFYRPDGSKNQTLGNLCYMIKEIGAQTDVTPIDARAYITKRISAADYEILKSVVSQKTNYGMHVMGVCGCPKCGSRNGYFIAMQQDKFFRPSLGDVRSYKQAVRSGDWKNLPGNPADYVRADS